MSTSGNMKLYVDGTLRDSYTESNTINEVGYVLGNFGSLVLVPMLDIPQQLGAEDGINPFGGKLNYLLLKLVHFMIMGLNLQPYGLELEL